MKSKLAEERSLAERLKGEAKAAAPEFSPVLHARIMERCATVAMETSIEMAKRAEMSRPRTGAAAIRRPAMPAWVGTAVAAALMIGIGGIWFGLSPKSAIDVVGPDQAIHDADMVSVDPASVRIQSPVAGDSAERIGDTVMLDQTEFLDTTVQLVETALTAQQWAYLEHDAQVLANLLFDQVPREVRATGGL